MLVIALIIGCAGEVDNRPDWSLYIPKLDTVGEYTDSVRWRVESSVTDGWIGGPELEAGLLQTTDSWSKALACGTKIEHVSDPDAANLVFHCMPDPDDAPFSENDLITVGIDEDGTRHVAVDPDWCRGGGREFHTYVMGRGLGFAPQSVYHKSVMRGVSLTHYGMDRDNGIETEELDGFRIWALRHSAPGCGAEDPKWSWEQDPDRYKSYPDSSDLNLILTHK